MNIRKQWPLLAASFILILSGCGRSPKLNSGNIERVLKAMTLEEKASLVVGLYAEGRADSTWGGIIATCPIERLGIPSITIAPPDTLAIADAVVFPSPLMQASSWDTELIEETAEAIGHQEVDCGADLLMAPRLNLLRNPLSGGYSQNYSEDPLVSGKSAAAAIKGMGHSGAGAVPGSFAAANHKSYGNKYDACITPRTLRELYLKGFEIALAESAPVAISIASNKINSTPAATNPELLGTLLREEWKFQGTVIGTCGNGEEAAAKIAAGCDLLPPCEAAQRDSIFTFAGDGRLRLSALDSSVRNVLKLIVSTPEFKKGKKREEEHPEPDLKAVARKAAADGIILLENRFAALPVIDSLSELITVLEVASDSTIAIKPALEQALTQAGCNITGSEDEADMALVVITRRSEKGDRLAEDFDLTSEERSIIEQTCQRFHADDRYVVVILNVDAVVETASWKELPDAILLAFAPGSEGPGALADIITGTVAPSGHLTVTLPEHLGFYPSMRNFPVAHREETRPEGEKMRPGQTGGRAGAMPPRGGMARRDSSRIPGGGFEMQRRDTSERARRFRAMFALSAKDSADRAAMGVRNQDYFLYQEGLFVGYRFFTSFGRSVSYPFGHGLTYTTFKYGEPDVIVRRNSLKVYVDITNSGNLPGREVVQVYVVAPEGSLDKPLLSLVAYEKTPEIAPGETYNASFVIPFDALASYNGASAAWSVDAGSYILKIGPSCLDIRSEAAAVLDNSYSVHTNDILQLHHRIDEIHLRRSIFRERVRGEQWRPDSSAAAPASPVPAVADSARTN
ncbi:MAG: glycoside hydrolase family 3 C-terminal domain-containing protein [Bacteroidales bacterium]|nr:glycoside hydrolase family 3 C-terminal domain-containing protein [Bacteroidales bacterium]